MDELNFNSVETIPNLNASAAFQVDSSKVFKEDTDIVPVIVDDTLSYVPWGGDNALPYNILELIESDETLSTCSRTYKLFEPPIFENKKNYHGYFF